MHFPEPTLCRDLTEEMFAFYSQSDALATRLLDHMARLSTPYDCEAYILAFFSRVVMRTWLPGPVSLTIIRVGTYSACFTLATEPNKDDPEIIYQNNFNVSVASILEILALSNAVLPFEIKGCSTSKIILSATTDKRFTTLPPSAFSYADADLDSDHPDGVTLFAQLRESQVTSNTGIYFRPPPVGQLITVLQTPLMPDCAESKGRQK